MLAWSVVLPVGFTVLFLVVVSDPDAYIGLSAGEVATALLVVYGLSGGAFFLGRILAKIAPHR